VEPVCVVCPFATLRQCRGLLRCSRTGEIEGLAEVVRADLAQSGRLRRGGQASTTCPWNCFWGFVLAPSPGGDDRRCAGEGKLATERVACDRRGDDGDCGRAGRRPKGAYAAG